MQYSWHVQARPQAFYRRSSMPWAHKDTTIRLIFTLQTKMFQNDMVSGVLVAFCFSQTSCNGIILKWKSYAREYRTEKCANVSYRNTRSYYELTLTCATNQADKGGEYCTKTHKRLWFGDEKTAFKVAKSGGLRSKKRRFTVTITMFHGLTDMVFTSNRATCIDRLFYFG